VKQNSQYFYEPKVVLMRVPLLVSKTNTAAAEFEIGT
jgi:hypothetical protein